MKTFFENLGDIAERGQELEQNIRLCISAKASYESLPFRSDLVKHKIEAYTRYERLLRREIKRFKTEIIEQLKNE